MPRGDGTGPMGGGGQGRRSGRGLGRRMGGGRMGGFAAGPGGHCVCPNCGEKVPHQQGVPCAGLSCPECGARMTREL